MKKVCIFMIFSTCLLMGTNVSAFGLKNVLGVGSKGSGVDAKSLENDQSALLKQVTAALLSLSKSQAIMANALGLKEQAAIANQNASALEAGDLTGKDDMEKKISSSQEVNDAIQVKMSESEEMSAESKVEFAKSLLPYGKGASGIVTSSKTATEKAESLSGTKDFTVLTKLGALLSYAKKAPGLISSFTSSTGGIIKFSKANGIDTAELESETAAW